MPNGWFAPSTQVSVAKAICNIGKLKRNWNRLRMESLTKLFHVLSPKAN
jgi:hypothetical protein